LTPDQQLQKLMEFSEGLNEHELAKALKTRAILERKKGEWRSVEVKMPHTVGVEEDSPHASYGTIIFRPWRNGEVTEIISNPLYQKANRLVKDSADALPRNQPLTADENKELNTLVCRMIAKALHPSMNIDEKFLIDLEDFAWNKFVFSAIAARTGMDDAFIKDVEEFFREPLRPGIRGEVDATLPAPPKPDG